MNRRAFLRRSAALTSLAWCSPRLAAQDQKASVMTVQGPIAPEQMGRTLVHEHILVDFIGADKVRKDRYDPDAVVKVALPHLKRIKELGCRTFIDCTPAYLGRDAALLKRLAAASELHVLTNTGYYGARQGKFLPEFVMKETAEQLAARWLREWTDGIDGTGIRPGFIKVGVDAGALPEVNRKLIQAAARTHLASGLTIAAHTGDGIAALEEIKLVREAGVDGSAFIWVHAQNEKDTALHVRAAARGAWVEFDGVGPRTVGEHVEFVKAMKIAGHLNRVLLSHDAGWYHVGEPDGGTFRSFDTLFTELLPALKKAGLTDAEWKQLTVDSPREAFTIRVRGRKPK
jgi:phosphotriesterase-related protein